MRPRNFYTVLFPVVFSCWACAGGTIDTLIFTASAGGTISGSITYDAAADGTASLTDVTNVDISTPAILYYENTSMGQREVLVPAVVYTLADLASFSVALDPSPCGTLRFPPIPPADVCLLLSAGLVDPEQQYLGLTVDYDPDPAIGNVEALASFEPVPEQEGFHGGVTSYAFTTEGAAAPEPSTLFLSCAVCGVAWYLRRRRLAGRIT